MVGFLPTQPLVTLQAPIEKHIGLTWYYHGVPNRPNPTSNFLNFGSRPFFWPCFGGGWAVAEQHVQHNGMYNAEILTAPGAYIANPSHPWIPGRKRQFTGSRSMKCLTPCMMIMQRPIGRAIFPLHPCMMTKWWPIGRTIFPTKKDVSRFPKAFGKRNAAIKAPSDHTEQDALGSLLWQRAFWIFSASADEASPLEYESLVFERGFNRMTNWTTRLWKLKRCYKYKQALKKRNALLQ